MPVIDAIAHAALDAAVATDLDGKILVWNERARQVFGWTPDEIIGKSIHETIIPSHLRPGHMAGMRAYKRRDGSDYVGQRLEREAKRKDGSDVVVELSMMRLPREDQEVILAFMRDMTSERAAQQNVEDLQSKLIHVSRVNAMGTMAATLAHELNQPLTAAKSYLAATSRLLAKGDPNSLALAREGLSGAREAVSHAGETIRCVRQMAEKRPAAARKESLASMTHDVLRLLRGVLSGIDLTTDLHADADSVMCSRVQIEQVLLNLVRNAAEALADNAAGKIVLSARRDADRIEIRVRDNGPGLPSAVNEALFAPFTSTKDGGMGMGLSICRTIVEQHSGHIWYEQEEVGTSACFTLPIWQPKEQGRSTQ